MVGAVAGDAVGAVGVAANARGHQIQEMDASGGGQQMRAGDGPDDRRIVGSEADIAGVGAEDKQLVDVADLVAIPVVFSVALRVVVV